MAGVSLGFFTPSMLVRDVGAFCKRVREIAPVSSRGFSWTSAPAQNDADGMRVSFATFTGGVPIHVEKPPAGPQFWLIMAALNRPALISAPADEKTSNAILNPDGRGVWGMGCLELRDSLVVHLDVARHWKGITAIPTGEMPPGEPAAVMIVVPAEDPAAIQRAVSRARQAIVADGRFSDLVR